MLASSTSSTIDVALRIGELPNSAMLATRVATLRLVTCASPAYLELRGTPVAPAASHPA